METGLEEGACVVVAAPILLIGGKESPVLPGLFSEEHVAKDVSRIGKKGIGYANVNYKARCQRCGELFTSWSPYPLIWHLEDHILMNHALECAFCDFVAEDFSDLSLHVVRDHKKGEYTTVEKTETVEETAIRWQSECDEANEKLKFLEDSEMLQKPGSARKSFTGKKTRWLQDSDLNEKPSKAVIVAAKADTGGTSVIVKLDLGAGVVVFDTWRHTNPNFDIAVEELGADETKWAGSEMEMFLEYDSFSDRNWRRIRFIGRKGKRKE